MSRICLDNLTLLFEKEDLHYQQDKSSGAGGGEASDAISPVAPVPDPLEDEALGPANKNYWRPGRFCLGIDHAVD